MIKKSKKFVKKEIELLLDNKPLLIFLIVFPFGVTIFAGYKTIIFIKNRKYYKEEDSE